MKLACETCPWWTCETRGNEFAGGTCHNAAANDRDRQAAYQNPHHWCSLHPAAPKPIYQIGVVYPELVLDAGWEPMPAFDRDGNVMMRRIIGYTKGGE